VRSAAVVEYHDAMVRTVEVPAPLAPVFAAAEKLVGAFFATRVDRPEEARIEIGGERFLLLRASSLSIDFHDAMRELFDAGSDEALGFVTDLLFHLAHDLGKTDAAAMRRKLGVDDPLTRVGPRSAFSPSLERFRATTASSYTTTRIRSRPTAGCGLDGGPTGRSAR
jgi:hypothetical protein